MCVQSMCIENYNTLAKVINEDLDILCSWIRRHNIKMSSLTKLIHRFNESSIQIPTGSFGSYQLAYYKIMGSPRLEIIKMTLKIKKVIGLMLPDFNTYY